MHNHAADTAFSKMTLKKLEAYLMFLLVRTESIHFIKYA